MNPIRLVHGHGDIFGRAAVAFSAPRRPFGAGGRSAKKMGSANRPIPTSVASRLSDIILGSVTTTRPDPLSACTTSVRRTGNVYHAFYRFQTPSVSGPYTQPRSHHKPGGRNDNRHRHCKPHLQPDPQPLSFRRQCWEPQPPNARKPLRQCICEHDAPRIASLPRPFAPESRSPAAEPVVSSPAHPPPSQPQPVLDMDRWTVRRENPPAEKDRLIYLLSNGYKAAQNRNFAVSRGTRCRMAFFSPFYPLSSYHANIICQP